MLNVPPTGKVIRRRGHGLKSYSRLTESGSELETPGFKASGPVVILWSITIVYLFVCLFCCFTSQVNSYGHSGTVSSANHFFSVQA